MNGLKIILWVTAICCLLGFASAALPWPTITGFCEWAGVQPPTPQPLTVFLYRLCSAIFGMIGVFFVILARNPLKYGAMLPLAGYALVCYGALCLAGGIRYGLPVWIYAGDAVFGLVAGTLLLGLRGKAGGVNEGLRPGLDS